MVFAPNSPELAAALQFTVQAALQRWLGDLIELQDLDVTCVDSTLSVVVQYAVRTTTNQKAARASSGQCDGAPMNPRTQLPGRPAPTTSVATEGQGTRT